MENVEKKTEEKIIEEKFVDEIMEEINIEMPILERQVKIGMENILEGDPQSPKEIFLEKLEEKIENNDIIEEPKSDLKPDVIVSEKVKRIDILRQLQQLSEKSGLPLPKNYRKMKKAALKEELAKMMNESISYLGNIPTNEPVKEEDATSNKEDIIIQGLYNFGLLTLDVTENLSKQPFCKAYTNNYVINGWSNKFRENPMMETELKSCLKEIYAENDWLSEYLSVWNRLYMILGLSLMTSVEKEADTIVEDITEGDATNKFEDITKKSHLVV